MDRVTAALQLIKDRDPVRYRRLPRDIDRIFINVLIGANGQYRAAINACELDERFVLDEATSLEIIAAVIVHEATHARLAHLGFKYEESRRARLEGISIRRELAFVARLPNGEAARELIEWRRDNMPDLTNAAFAQRRNADEWEATRYLRIPDRVVRAMLALRTGINASRRFGYKARRLWRSEPGPQATEGEKAHREWRGRCQRDKHRRT